MLPRETSVRQLKKLRAETKGTDIGDLTTNDRLNDRIPNLQRIGNPVDTGIESWEEFSKKDSKLQTIAFKSKLVNKNVKEGFMANMSTGAMMTAATLGSMSASSANGKPEHTITQSQEKTELEVMQEVKSDINNCYAYASGQSPDIATAKKIAISNAKIKLSKEIGLFFYGMKTSLLANKFEIKKELITMAPNGGYIYHVVLSSPREIKENKQEIMEKIENVLKFKDFDKSEKGSHVANPDDNKLSGKKNGESKKEITEGKFKAQKGLNVKPETNTTKPKIDYAGQKPQSTLKKEDVKTFESFSVPAAKKEEKQPEYTILGEEKELKSNPLFGIGEVKAQEIKKITDFNLIDPHTPKERPIGGNAGIFIDNDIVKGYLNRIEGKDVYVESIDEPMVIKKFSLKDAVKTKKS